MANASLPGYGGSVASDPDFGATGGAPVTEITDWEINIELDDEETTSFESAGWKEYTSTLLGATVNFNCVGKQMPPIDRTPRELTLLAAADATAGPSIVGDALCRSVNIKCPVSGTVKYAWQGVFCGALVVDHPDAPA